LSNFRINFSADRLSRFALHKHVKDFALGVDGAP
jgi:hypothetical protein